MKCKNKFFEKKNAREKCKNRKILDVYISKIPDNVEISELYPIDRQKEIESVTNQNLKVAKFWVWKVLEYAFFRSFSLKIDEVAPRKSKSGKWVSKKCYFSLSHTKGLVAVAISNAPVGVDIENAEEFARKFHEDQDLIQKIADKLRTKKERRGAECIDLSDLMTLWVKKESVFKKSNNKGVFRPQKLLLDKEKISTKIDKCEEIGYCLSVCGKNIESARYLFCDKI